jgi:tetratricopeptide (TPR) repeat protein
VNADPILAMCVQGLQALRAGDAVAAAQLGERATRMAPARADGWLLLSSALKALGSVDVERALADALAHLAPDDDARTTIEIERASALAMRGRSGEAAEIAFRVRTAPNLSPRNHDVLGSTFASISLFDLALEHCRIAVTAMPGDATARYNLATALRYLGRLDEAEAEFGRVLEIAPTHSLAFAALASLRRWTPERNHLATLEAAVARTPEGESGAQLRYATFKELNDLGRHAEAWASLSDATAIVRRMWPYPREVKRARVAALLEAFSAARLQNAPRRETPGHKPIFIFGLPRSGTTLTERILAAHSRVTAMGETSGFMQAMRAAIGRPRVHEIDADMLRRIAEADFGEIARLYVAYTAYLAPGADLATEKLPHNYEYVGAMHLAFPDAPLVHVRRAPMDSLFGAYRLMFAEGAYLWSYGFEDLAENYRQYRQLMAHWKAALGERIVEVRLEDLIDEPEAQIRRLLDRCGLSFEAACLSPHTAEGGVSTASSSQVRAPINREGVGAWRRYARELEPLRAMLERDGFVDRNGDPVD